MKDTPDDIELRCEAAHALAKEGKLAEALAEYLWLYDVGMPATQGYGGVRNSYHLSAIASLGKLYPPALDALRERADAARERLLGSEQEFEDARDFAAIARYLGRQADVLALWDELAAQDRLEPILRMALLEAVLDLLMARRRWADVAWGVRDPLERFANRVQMFHSAFEQDPPQLKFAEHMKRSAVRDGAKIWKALLGAGDERSASLLEERMLAFDPSVQTFAALFDAALDLGLPEEAELMRMRSFGHLDEQGRSEFDRHCERRRRGDHDDPLGDEQPT